VSRSPQKFLLRAASFLLAGVLLYLALRGTDLGRVWTALQQADYRWAIPAVLVTLISHYLRAWRWQILLNTLPTADAVREKSISINASFGSLMIGYMVNYAAPRLGEIARSAHLSRREKLSFSSVLGTVAIERILDIVILAGAMTSVFVLLADQLPTIYNLFFTPSINYMADISPLWIIGGAAGMLIMGAASIGYFWYRSRSEAGWLARLWEEHLLPIIERFIKGGRSMFRTGRPLSIFISTAGMWLGYLIMAYIPLVMLDMVDPYDLSLLDTWAIMTLGTLGILVPVPGGTGSYHYITIQTMVYLFAVDQTAAATYAVLTHAGQMLIYVTVGMGYLLAQGSVLHQWNQQSAEASSAR
jgi:uncharacterized protein (TIRG00374 family)